MATALPKTMRALQIVKEGGSTPSLKLTEVTTPSPKAGEILLKIHASPILPSDILNSKGSFPSTTFPRVPGRDFAGAVVSGPNNLIGKTVFGTSGSTLSFTRDGAHAEYAAIPADGVVLVPEGLSLAQAANLGTTWSTAQLALKHSRAKKGEIVMVLGASGTVGSAVVQLATRIGCRVLRVGRGDGADVNSVADPALEAARALTNGRGPGVVIDTVGDANLVKASLGVLASGGRFSFITAPRGPEGSGVLVDFLAIYRKEIELVGNNSVAHTQEELAESLAGLVEGFEKGELKAAEIGKEQEVRLEGAVEAYGKKGRWTLVME